MALVHLKREIAEFEGYPLECDVQEESVAEMEKRGWSVVKKTTEKASEKVVNDKKETTVDIKEAANGVGNRKKEN